MRRVYGFFWLPIARLHGIFPRQDRGFKEFRGFPDMELGIFRVAKILRWGPRAQEIDVFKSPRFRCFGVLIASIEGAKGPYEATALKST